MAVFNVARLPHRGKAHMALLLPHEDNIPNKFRIFERKAYSDEKTVPVAWLD